MGIHSHTLHYTPSGTPSTHKLTPKKNIYYLPLYNSPGRFLSMPHACISFLFLWVSTPLQPPFLFVILKESTPLCNMSFSLHILSLCVRRRERSRVGVDLSKSVWTHALPQTHNRTHTLRVPRQRFITLQSITTSEEFTQPMPSDSCGGIQRNPISAVSQNSNEQPWLAEEPRKQRVADRKCTTQRQQKRETTWIEIALIILIIVLVQFLQYSICILHKLYLYTWNTWMTYCKICCVQPE